MPERGPSLGGRMAARWSRAEPAVTRVLLLAVFCVGLVAQFVKPVGDALQGKTYIGGALLSIVGYVLYAEVLRLNTAHDAQREQTRHLDEAVRRLGEEVRDLTARLRPQAGEHATTDQLVRECAEVLRRGGDVELWGMCFTGETFADPLRRVLEELPADPSRSVDVRILVPDFTRPMEVPGLVRDEDGKLADAPGFRRYLVGKIAGYERDLQAMRGRMLRRGQGTLTVGFRVVHMSPFLKLYVIGGDVVFEGIYDKIDLRPDEYRSLVPAPLRSRDDDQLLDLIGHGSLLTRWSRDDGERAREVVARRRAFFRVLWEAASPPEPPPAPGGGR
ncbi:ATP/GTP-binding protein [Streptomyces sp. NPDC032940]|uniref:ATP/GTP-binding protein n=1 Tax=Streptomyces sp. NPDC032940 TaxID=3155366 RepID=UPI0033FE9978